MLAMPPPVAPGIEPVSCDKHTKAHPARLDALTSLRFFAALSIFILHAQQMGLAQGIPAADLPALAQAVPFFFTLSGFVLAYNYPPMSGLQDALVYLRHRFARVAPLYFLTAVPYLL